MDSGWGLTFSLGLELQAHSWLHVSLEKWVHPLDTPAHQSEPNRILNFESYPDVIIGIPTDPVNWGFWPELRPAGKGTGDGRCV